MPRSETCAETDSCPLCHSRVPVAPLFFRIHVFVVMSHSQRVKNSCELTTIATKEHCLKACLQMEVIKVLVEVVRVISAKLFQYTALLLWKNAAFTDSLQL